MFDFVEKHPCSFTFLVCLLLFLAASIFYGSSYISDVQISYLTITGLLALGLNGFYQRIGFILLALGGFLSFLAANTSSIGYLLGEYGILFLFILLNRTKNNIYLIAIIAAAFLLHLYYIQITPVNIRQHDLNGIMLYMHLITLNGINIFNFNPWHMYYLFHQPLHFIIAGYLFSAEIYLWNSRTLAAEGLQYLSLLYVTLTTLIAAGIFKELKITGKTFYACVTLFAFHPTFILFSGYISDDVPTIFWSVFIIYFIILWYKTEQSKYIACAAIGFGVGVLTKLSVLMLVPALCFIFIHKLFTTRENRQKIIQQLCLFIIIAVPLALLWIIRNHILFDMQFYNIPDTSPAGQNFKYLTLQERIGDFSMLFQPFINVPEVSDANIFLALIKTELFGEWDLSLIHPIIYWPAFALYILNIFIKIFALAGCLLIFCNSSKHHPAVVMLAILYLTVWGYAIKYALDYPYICSTDFRLFAQLILPETVLLSAILAKKIKSTAFLTITVIYAVLNCFIYIAGI